MTYFKKRGTLCVSIILAVFIPIALTGNSFALEAVSDTSAIKSVSDILIDENEDGELDLLQSTVTFSGRATVSSSALSEQNLMVYMQDQSAGVLVFADSLSGPPIQPGDSLIVTGELQLYYGNPEVVVDHYRIVDVPPKIPPAVSINAAYKDPQKYLGMLVEGEAEVVGRNRNEQNIRLQIAPSNTSAHSLSIYISQSHPQFSDFNRRAYRVGDEISITGVIERYTFQSTGNTIYEIKPRRLGDIRHIKRASSESLPGSSNVRSVSEILVDENNDGQLDFLRRTVTVGGRTTVSSSVLSEQNLMVYMQDQLAGVLVFSDTLRKPPIRKGDSLIVTGELQLYYGNPEIVVDSYRLADTEPRIPTAVSLDKIYSNPEKYLGMLIQGKAVVVGKSRDEENIRLEIALSDTSERSLYIYVPLYHSQFDDFNIKWLSVGDEVAVQGILDKYTFQNSGNTIYEILLRTPEDLEHIGLPQVYLNIILWGGGILAVIIISWVLLLRRKVKSKTKEISQQLEEKEVLMHEIHHRVKNNLAIISGLLELEAMNWEDDHKVSEVLHESMLRVRSIGMIHEQLYNSNDLANLSLDEYLKKLVNLISSTFNTGDKAINFEIEADDVQMNINQAIPCGLIVSELVANAYEHGFKETGEGTIKVQLQKTTNYITLVVADNGKGLPKNFKINNSKTLGLRLVKQLAKQLEGKLNIQNGEGTRFEIKFKKEDRSGSASHHFI